MLLFALFFLLFLWLYAANWIIRQHPHRRYTLTDMVIIYLVGPLGLLTGIALNAWNTYTPANWPKASL